MTLPYVSRTRSAIAQYIKQDNDGRRTAGNLQPGIVNKTVDSVLFTKSDAGCFKTSLPVILSRFYIIFGFISRLIAVWFLHYAYNGELG